MSAASATTHEFTNGVLGIVIFSGFDKCSNCRDDSSASLHPVTKA